MIRAHDEGKETPPIPLHIYRTARPFTAATHILRSNSEQGKRKRDLPHVEATETEKAKKCRVVKEYSGYSSHELEDDAEFEDDLDHDEEPKHPKSRALRLLLPTQPTTSHDDVAQPRPRSRAVATNASSLESKSARKPTKRRAEIKSAELVPDESGDETVALPSAAPTPNVPPLSVRLTVSEANRRAFWKQDGYQIDTKGREAIMLMQCEKCRIDKRRCWTLEGMKACLYCRVIKKVGCSHAQEGVKVSAPKAGSSKASKETKEKGRVPVGKEEPKKVADNESRKNRDQPITEGSTSTSARKARGRSRSRPPSAPSKMAGQDMTLVPCIADKGNSVVDVAGVTAAAHSIHAAAPQPPPAPQTRIITDPLVCAPAELIEVQCKYSTIQ